MVKKITYSIILLSLFSCKNEKISSAEDLCGVSDPVNNIGWLKNAINELEADEFTYFNSAIYEGSPVVYSGNCDPAVNFVSFLQNCSGDTLGFTNEFYERLSDVKLLWKSEDSKCELKSP